MKTTTVSVRLPRDEAEQLQELAAQVGLERSTLLKQALRRGSAQVLFDYACEAYRHGEVTLSRAGELAGIGIREFLLRLPDGDLELNYRVSDLARDLEA